MDNRCTRCGHLNIAGVDVCSQCAAPLNRICQNCGFQNPANFKFCGGCGASLQTTAPSRAPAEPIRQRPQSGIPAALAEKISRLGKQIEGERRTVTILFADISGFTAISENLDPEQVYEIVDSTLKAFVDEIYKHEGTLDKFMGDGLMALFGAPVAHEDDAARAVRAAVGMQSALGRINEDLEARLGIALKVRIGLNSGTVVVGTLGTDLRMDYTALGDSVNVASRLQNVAEPGTTLVSRAVYEQTNALFEYRELGSIRVKGRLEPVEIFEFIAPLKRMGRLRGIPGLTAPMVGRAEEFGRLRDILDELVEKGQGRIVLLTGDAGIGKSRLTAELRRYGSGKPARVVEAACLAYGQTAYSIFLRLLRSFFQISDEDSEQVVREKIEHSVRRVLPDASVPQVLPYIENLLSIRIVDKELAERVRHLEPGPLQQQTFVAVRELLTAEARKQPLVLIFEDIHWIDKISLDLLTFLCGAVPDVPLLLFGNSRPGEGPAAPALQRLGHELYASHYVHVPLLPLSHADSVALIDLLLTIAELPENLKEMIPQRAEGNPFYLEEIIRMLIDRGIICRTEGHWQLAPEADWAGLEVPRTLEGLIMTRVDSLTEGARHAIQFASVIGRDFQHRLLSTVVENPRNLIDDLQELQERQLIQRAEGSSDLEYRFQHILIQETVYNSLLIRRRERLHHKVAEGIETVFQGRLNEYVEELAFHFVESKDASRALPYLIQAGQHAADRFANDQALGYYRQAAESLTKTTPTLQERIDVYRGLGQVQNFVGDYEGALNSYLMALELIRTSGVEQIERTSAEIMRRIARVHEGRGDYTEALRWLEMGLGMLDRDPESRKAVERARIYNEIGWVNYRRGQFEEAYQWRMRGLALIEGTDHYNEMASAYNGLVGLFTQQGDWARAIAYAEKGLRLRQMIGDSYGVSASHNNLGSIALEQCDLDQALYHFERSLELKQKIGDIEGIARVSANLAMVCRDKGNYERSAQLCASALHIAEGIKNRAPITLALNNLAHIKILQGQVDSAFADLTRSLEIATEMGYKERLAEAHRLLAEVALAQGNLDQANTWAEQARTIASDMGRQFILGEATRTLARIARSQRKLEIADAFLQESLNLFASLKNPLELAKSQFELALVQRDRGLANQAQTLLDKACTTFEQLGAEAEHQRTRTELDALDLALPRPTPEAA